MRVFIVIAGFVQVFACAGLALVGHSGPVYAFEGARSYSYSPPRDVRRPGVPPRPGRVGVPGRPKAAHRPAYDRYPHYGQPHYGDPAYGYGGSSEAVPVPYHVMPHPPPEPILTPPQQMLADLGRCHALGITSLVDCLRDRHSSVAIRRLETCIRSSTVPEVPDEARACLSVGHW